MYRVILLFFVAFSPIFSLPVTKTSPKKPVEEPTATLSLEHNLEYERYLREIVTALESDPEFRKKLDQASEDDIRSGNIAHELDYVNHQVRTKLDEIKREEMERLRSLVNKQYKLSHGIDENHLKVSQLGHVDHSNEHTFEVEDLKKLILKTSEDLNVADQKRREEFKQYELQKEFEKQEELRGYDEKRRAEHEAEMEKLRKKHNDHPRIHHPGNRPQLEEVWEEQDHMKGLDFDPQTFFMIHDLDSNGVWDQNEVKALFIKELDKLYQQGLPEDDMRERAEEMERMREHVFKEADQNRDGIIDFNEFIAQTKREEFQRDPGWDTVDTEKTYTHEEYLKFEERRQAEIRKMMIEQPEKFRDYPQYQHYQNQQEHDQHIDQNHLQQEQHYQNQQQHPQQQYPNQQQHHPSQQQQHQQQQFQNQQQHYQNKQQQNGQINQQEGFQQPPQQQPPQQQPPQQQPPQQQNQQQQPPQKYNNQNAQIPQQNINQQQGIQQPPQQNQQIPVSNSASNQLNTNRINSVEDNKINPGQPPQVLHTKH